MKLGLWISFLVWGITASADTSAGYQRAKCDASFGNVTWHHLTLNEPALNEAYKMIVQHSGSTKLTNCAIDYPVKDGKAINGVRRVVMDSQWYTTQFIDGVEKRTFRHEGIMVEYDYVPGQTGMLRDVLGFSVCRTPELCTKLGIPFKLPTTKPSLPQTF